MPSDDPTDRWENDGSLLIDQAPFGSCGMLRIGTCGACTFEKSKTAIAATMTAATPRLP